MSYKRVARKMIATAAFSILLLAGTAEAGSFTDSGKLAGFDMTRILDQAWGWLESLWADSSTTPPPATQSAQSCPPPGCPSDSGWGIDPNGGN